MHHRLVVDESRGNGGRKGRERDIGYVKYLCKAYEWALRVRRDEGVRARIDFKEASLAIVHHHRELNPSAH